MIHIKEEKHDDVREDINIAELMLILSANIL